jgi:hypothetical protein
MYWSVNWRFLVTLFADCVTGHLDSSTGSDEDERLVGNDEDGISRVGNWENLFFTGTWAIFTLGVWKDSAAFPNEMNKMIPNEFMHVFIVVQADLVRFTSIIFDDEES